MVKIKSNLLQRLITGLTLAPIVLASIYYGFPYYLFLVIIAGALLSWEWSTMVPNSKQAFYAVTYTTAMALMLALFPIDLDRALFCILVLVVASLLVWFKSKDEKHRKLLTLGVPYIAIGIGSLNWMYAIVGSVGVIWFLLIVWSVDIGGYVVGRNLKGPKLAPKISPNKTWSGLFGGMLFAACTSAILAHLYSWGSVVNYAAIAAFLAVIEQVGDLVESAIKRHLNIKDSSSIIPGHGGVFDRIDGLIFTAPILIIMLILLSNLFM